MNPFYHIPIAIYGGALLFSFYSEHRLDYRWWRTRPWHIITGRILLDPLTISFPLTDLCVSQDVMYSFTSSSIPSTPNTTSVLGIDTYVSTIQNYTIIPFISGCQLNYTNMMCYYTTYNDTSCNCLSSCSELYDVISILTVSIITNAARGLFTNITM